MAREREVYSSIDATSQTSSGNPNSTNLLTLAGLSNQALERVGKQSQHTASNSSDGELNAHQPSHPNLLEHSAGALSARLGYLGLTDQLHIDQYTMRRELAGLKSPVAKQLIQTMDELKRDGWQILPFKSTASLGGEYNEFSQRIWYSPAKFSTLSHITGVGPSAIKSAAGNILAHELAHHKPPVVYTIGTSDWAAVEVMSKRTLIGEAKAMLAEVHISDELGVTQGLTLERRNAMMNGHLGSQILRDHAGNTIGMHGKYNAANSLVHDYLDRTFGTDVIDRTNRRIRPYDINAGRIQPNLAELPDDGDFLEWKKNVGYRELRKDPLYEHRGRLAVLLRSGETRIESIAMRAGKALGAVGAFMAVNDVSDAFHESAGTGVGRLGKIGADWTGFELATLAGRKVAGSFLSKCPRVGALATFALGMVGAYGAGQSVGSPAEIALKESIDNGDFSKFDRAVKTIGRLNPVQ